MGQDEITVTLPENCDREDFEQAVEFLGENPAYINMLLDMQTAQEAIYRQGRVQRQELDEGESFRATGISYNKLTAFLRTMAIYNQIQTTGYKWTPPEDEFE